MVTTSSTFARDWISFADFASQIPPTLDHFPQLPEQPRQVTNESYGLTRETRIPSPHSARLLVSDLSGQKAEAVFTVRGITGVVLASRVG